MPFVPGPTVMALVAHAQLRLHLSQSTLGVRFGVSRRTIQRWQAGGGRPSIEQLRDLARDVYPRDPDLAARIAAETGATLESLGVIAPPPRPPEPVAPPTPPVRTFAPHAVVDAVVCAGADALQIPPDPMRRALRASLERARELGLTTDEILAALAPPPSAPRTKKNTTPAR